jgi:hypothetical protein
MSRIVPAPIKNHIGCRLVEKWTRFSVVRNWGLGSAQFSSVVKHVSLKSLTAVGGND